MKIIKLESFANEFVGFIRLTTEDGATGWGQVSTYHSDITQTVFHRQVAPWVLGRDTDDLPDLIDLVQRREHKYPGSYIMRALGGLDTAIWDLRGKQAGLPVTCLIGGTPGSIRAYASSMRRDITPAAEAERITRLIGEHGFDAFKFRVGSECGKDADEWPGRTEAILPAIRKAVGDDVALLVDANSCYSPARAIEVGHLLAENGISHFEEPCPYWEMEQTKEVTDALADLPLDVTGGEQDHDIHHWRRMIAMGAVNILQPDVMYMGGMHRTLELCAMGDAAGYKITPHCANLSMVTLFTMHLLRAIPNAGKYLEFSIEGPEYYPWQQELFVKSPYDITDGRATVTDEPGWGVELNPEWLARARYQVSEAEG